MADVISAKLPDTNPLGIASMVLAVIAFSVFLTTIWHVRSAHERQVEATERIEAEKRKAPSKLGYVYVFRGITSFVDAALKIAAILVGGTLSLVGFGLGLGGLLCQPYKKALAGILINAAGPAMFVLYLYANSD